MGVALALVEALGLVLVVLGDVALVAGFVDTAVSDVGVA